MKEWLRLVAGTASPLATPSEPAVMLANRLVLLCSSMPKGRRFTSGGLAHSIWSQVWQPAATEGARLTSPYIVVFALQE